MKNRGQNGTLDYEKVERTKEKKVGNVFFYSVGGGISTKDKIAYNHPAIFPEKLAADQINTWTNENDLVYDPFMGSGTTAKIAHLLKRKWIGSFWFNFILHQKNFVSSCNSSFASRILPSPKGANVNNRWWNDRREWNLRIADPLSLQSSPKGANRSKTGCGSPPLGTLSPSYG